MPITPTELKRAIDHSDMTLILRTIDEAANSPSNIFREDLSEGEDALIYAILHKPVTRDSIRIVQTLLHARDGHNRPLVNINATDNKQRTAMHHLLDNTLISKEDQFMLFELITDFRDENGRLSLDISACRWHHGTPLMDAIRIRHEDIFRCLLDLRREDGTYAVDINEARSNPPHTALDVAYMHLLNNEQGRAMEEALKQRGAKRYRDIHPESINEYRRSLGAGHPLHPDFDPKPSNRLRPSTFTVAQLPVIAAPVAAPVPFPNRPLVLAANKVQSFINDIQSTHGSQVTISGNASLFRLMKRYPKVNVQAALKEIDECVKHSDRKKRPFIMTRLSAIKCDVITKRSEVNLTLSEGLALIWVALHDKSVKVEGSWELTDKDIENRKLVLLNNLYLAQVWYGFGRGKNACFRGTFDKILESLDRCHPDVVLITAEDPAMIMQQAMMRTGAFIREELRTIAMQERMAILKSWDSSDNNAPSSVFRKVVTEQVSSLLIQEFATLLTTQQRGYIVDEIENLSKPIAHSELYNLHSHIDSLDSGSESLYIKELTESLKSHAFSAYKDYVGDDHQAQLAVIELKDNLIKYDLCKRLGDGRNGKKDAKKEVSFTAENLKAIDRISNALAQLNALEDLFKLMRTERYPLYTRTSNRHLLFFLPTIPKPMSATFQKHLSLLQEKYLEILQKNMQEIPSIKDINDFQRAVEASNLLDTNQSNYVSMQSTIPFALAKAQEIVASKILLEKARLAH